MLRDLFNKRKYVSVRPGKEPAAPSAPGKSAQKGKGAGKEVPDGLWRKCNSCGALHYAKELQRSFMVCEKCGYHFVIGARERLAQVLDDMETFVEFDANMVTYDPLSFPGYRDKLDRAEKTTGLREAVVTGRGFIGGMPVVVGVMDSGFIAATMGTVVGEKVTRAFERAVELGLPVVMFCTSGGARMQEGILSLMQMQKTTAAVEWHNRAGLFFISVMTHPTLAGVFASFASLGDINLAEPGAMVGFAGPSLIEQTIRRPVPQDLQTAETLLENGFLDAIVPRPELKNMLVKLLRFHAVGPAPGAESANLGQLASTAEDGR